MEMAPLPGDIDDALCSTYLLLPLPREKDVTLPILQTSQPHWRNKTKAWRQPYPGFEQSIITITIFHSFLIWCVEYNVLLRIIYQDSNYQETSLEFDWYIICRWCCPRPCTREMFGTKSSTDHLGNKWVDLPALAVSGALMTISGGSRLCGHLSIVTFAKATMSLEKQGILLKIISLRHNMSFTNFHELMCSILCIIYSEVYFVTL